MCGDKGPKSKPIVFPGVKGAPGMTTKIAIGMAEEKRIQHNHSRLFR